MGNSFTVVWGPEDNKNQIKGLEEIHMGQKKAALNELFREERVDCALVWGKSSREGVLVLRDDIRGWEHQSACVFLPLQSQTRLIADSFELLCIQRLSRRLDVYNIGVVGV